MTWQAWTLAILIAGFIVIQYTLAWSAVVDALHRPRVRGESHMLWILIILCVPVLGALAYGAMGPLSFRTQQMAKEPAADHEVRHNTMERPANVTPFRRSSGRMSDQITAQRPGLTRSRAHRGEGAVSRIHRPGA